MGYESGDVCHFWDEAFSSWLVRDPSLPAILCLRLKVCYRKRSYKEPPSAGVIDGAEVLTDSHWTCNMNER